MPEVQVCQHCQEPMFPQRHRCLSCNQQIVTREPRVVSGQVIACARYRERNEGYGVFPSDDGNLYSFTLMVELSGGQRVFGSLGELPPSASELLVNPEQAVGQMVIATITGAVKAAGNEFFFTLAQQQLQAALPLTIGTFAR